MPAPVPVPVLVRVPIPILSLPSSGAVSLVVDSPLSRTARSSASPSTSLVLSHAPSVFGSRAMTGYVNVPLPNNLGNLSLWAVPEAEIDGQEINIEVDARSVSPSCMS